MIERLKSKIERAEKINKELTGIKIYPAVDPLADPIAQALRVARQSPHSQ